MKRYFLTLVAVICLSALSEVKSQSVPCRQNDFNAFFKGFQSLSIEQQLSHTQLPLLILEGDMGDTPRSTYLSAAQLRTRYKNLSKIVITDAEARKYNCMYYIKKDPRGGFQVIFGEIGVDSGGYSSYTFRWVDGCWKLVTISE